MCKLENRLQWLSYGIDAIEVVHVSVDESSREWPDCRKGDVGWDDAEPEPRHSSAGRRYDNNRAKPARIEIEPYLIFLVMSNK
jgi:hypothetical protein